MILGKRRDERTREQEQRDRLIAYKRAFATPDGKAVLYDLMNRFHILNGHGGDTHKEGQRSVVLAIMNNCSISIEEFDRMMKGDE